MREAERGVLMNSINNRIQVLYRFSIGQFVMPEFCFSLTVYLVKMKLDGND